MMKNMKRWLAAALAVMLCLSLAACKGKDFDAKGYVKSVLDAHYHGEYKDYAKYLDISEEEAKAESKEEEPVQNVKEDREDEREEASPSPSQQENVSSEDEEEKF